MSGHSKWANIKHKKGSSLQRKNIVHIDANAETAIKPAFLGFMAVYSSSKCQRRDFMKKKAISP